MTDINEILSRAVAAAEKTQPGADVQALVKHGAEARAHVWDRHFASTSERECLAEKLAAASPEFQAAVAATENALADELAEDNLRRARVRAANPTHFMGNLI